MYLQFISFLPETLLISFNLKNRFLTAQCSRKYNKASHKQHIPFFDSLSYADLTVNIFCPLTNIVLNGYAENVRNSLLKTIFLMLFLSIFAEHKSVFLYKKVLFIQPECKLQIYCQFHIIKNYFLSTSIYKNDFLKIFYCLRDLNLKSTRILN